MDINRGDYLEGARDIVVEIESPGDETRQKLPFYAELDVPEVWIIDRDSKEPEIYLLRGQKHRRQRSSANGWVRSPATSIELRAARAGKLSIRLIDNDETRQEIPED